MHFSYCNQTYQLDDKTSENSKGQSRMQRISKGNQECREFQRAIKNEQSRETGNIGYTRHMTMTSKTKNTRQYV